MPGRAMAPSSQRRRARRTADRLQPFAQRTFEPTTIQPVVRLQLHDGRLHGLAPLQPPPLWLAQALVAAPMNDLHAQVVRIDLFASEPQVGHNLLDRDTQVLR